MDGASFDRLARGLAAGHTRRSVVKRLGAAALGALGLAGAGRASRAGAGQAKRSLCHATGDATNPWVVIDVAEPAWNDHAAHGDKVYVNCCTDSDCTGEYDTCGGGGVEGACGCTPDCSAATCADPGDGCGGTCSGACSPTITITFVPDPNFPVFCLVNLYLHDFAPNTTYSVQYVAKASNGTVFLAGAPFDVTTDGGGDADAVGSFPKGYELSAEAGGVSSGFQPVVCSA
jgi:hypothetical protein